MIPTALVLAALLPLPAPPSASPFITMRGGPRSVSCVGDVNGDGRPDFAVGVNDCIWAVSGSDATVIWKRPGLKSDGFGPSVAGMHDANGDCVRDVLVGAPGALRPNAYKTADEVLLGFDGFTEAGCVYVVSGKDGTPLQRWVGREPREQFGFEVRMAGDVNADGVQDWIAGAPHRAEKRGAAEVRSGKDGELLWTFDGGAEGVRLGTSVSGAGDVDGDGHADLVVGAPGSDSYRGMAFVYSGKTGEVLFGLEPRECDEDTNLSRARFGNSVSDAGDLDHDGHADVMVSADAACGSSGMAWVFSGADGSVLRTLGPGNGPFTSFGASVTSLPDVNGDGEIDLAVSDANNFYFVEGQPPKFFADSDGPRGQAPGGVFVFSGADGSFLWTIAGEAAFHSLGYSIDRCEDVDGDSVPDVLALSRRYVWVLSGKDGSIVLDFRWPAASSCPTSDPSGEKEDG
jgi:hypothetical protein